MDPRPQDIVDKSLVHLRRHWIALAGVGVAAVMGGGFAKVLAPEELSPVPAAALQITAPPAPMPAEDMRLSYNGRLPDYVIGSDLARPARDYAIAPFSEDIQPVTETRFDDDRYERPHYRTVNAMELASGAARSEPRAPHNREAINALQMATDDAFAALPAMAPG